MSPESLITVYAALDLLRDLPGVSGADLQAVGTFIGVCVERAERAGDDP